MKLGESTWEHAEQPCLGLKSSEPSIFTRTAKDWTEWAEQGGSAEQFKKILDATTCEKRDGIHLTPFSTITPHSAEWALQGRVAANALNLLVGEPGEGKTTTVIDWIAQWSQGQAEGDWLGKPTHIVIASCEDSPSTTLRPRLQAAGADLERVHGVSMQRDGMEGGLSIPEDIPALEKQMEHVGARALIIDPIMGHLGDVDSHKDQSIRKALAPLAKLAERLKAVVLGIMHLNKRECSSITGRVSGSVGFVAAARSVLLAAQDPESEEHEQHVLVHAKCNLGPHAPTLRYALEETTITHEGHEIKTSLVVWMGEEQHIHISDVLRIDSQHSHEPSQKAEAKDWLGGFLEDGPRASEEVLREGKKQGFSQKTLYRAKKDLSIKEDKTGFGKNGKWAWHLCIDGQDVAKDGRTQDIDHLKVTHRKNSDFSNNLFKDGQPGVGDHLNAAEQTTMSFDGDGNAPEQQQGAVMAGCHEDDDEILDYVIRTASTSKSPIVRWHT